MAKVNEKKSKAGLVGWIAGCVLLVVFIAAVFWTDTRTKSSIIKDEALLGAMTELCDKNASGITKEDLESVTYFSFVSPSSISIGKSVVTDEMLEGDGSALGSDAKQVTLKKDFGDMAEVFSLLPGLKYLDISKSGLNISDLSQIESLKGLNFLVVDGIDAKSSAALAGFTELVSLSANETEFEDYSFISSLTNLKTLSLNEVAVGDLSAIGKLEKLTTLSLAGCSLNSIEELGNLTALKNLTLSKNSISNVAPIAKCTELTSLDICENLISDVSPLGALSALSALDLESNEIADISGLLTLKSLTSLSLGDNKISALPDLSLLENLSTLGLDNNEITDVSVLSGCGSIKTLDIQGNKIADVSPVAELTGLTSLDVTGNPANFEVLDSLKDAGCTIVGNETNVEDDQ